MPHGDCALADACGILTVTCNAGLALCVLLDLTPFFHTSVLTKLPIMKYHGICKPNPMSSESATTPNFWNTLLMSCFTCRVDKALTRLPCCHLLSQFLCRKWPLTRWMLCGAVHNRLHPTPTSSKDQPCCQTWMCCEAKSLPTGALRLRAARAHRSDIRSLHASCNQPALWRPPSVWVCRCSHPAAPLPAAARLPP